MMLRLQYFVTHCMIEMSHPDIDVYRLGDTYRYRAEIAMRKHDIAAADHCYTNALKHAQQSLHPSHPALLGAALNKCVLLQELKMVY